MMIGITDEEKQAFMMQMPPEQTADIKRKENGEFYVEKVIKMHVNKEGMRRISCQMGWVPTE